MTARRAPAAVAPAYPPVLDAARRARDLAALADGEPLDVLVIGGGITGAGVALDAAARGLRVALVERRDLAHGTSRWSSKLVHGGLRYLAQHEFGLAWQSARERHVLLTRTAPHLVQPFPMLVPTFTTTPRRERRAVSAGLRITDAMRRAAGTPGDLLPPPRRVGVAEALRLAPTLDRRQLTGGLLYWDGQLVDDARLVLAVARTAAAYGARVVTRCAAEQLEPGRAVLREERSGARLTLRPRHIVNATGVWADTLDERVAVAPSAGAHLVLREASLGRPRAGVTVAVPGERNRYVFTVPVADGLVHVGLTDDPHPGPVPDEPIASAADREFLLATLSAALDRPLSPADVVGSFAGLRPLLAGAPDDRSADLSRRHAVVGAPGGVLTVVGGKLTTYRAMARDAVDRLTDRRCPTRDVPLVGAAPRRVLAGLAAPRRYVERYGAEAPLVVAAAESDPALLEPVVSGVPVTGAELRFGLTHEGALDVADLLDRRTRVGLVPADRDRLAAVLTGPDSPVADLLPAVPV